MIASALSKLNPFVSAKRVSRASWPLEFSSVIYRFHYSPRDDGAQTADGTASCHHPPHIDEVFFFIVCARLSLFFLSSKAYYHSRSSFAPMCFMNYCSSLISSTLLAYLDILRLFSCYIILRYDCGMNNVWYIRGATANFSSVKR